MVKDALVEQYKSPSNLGARIQLHKRFSTSKKTWALWVFDHFDLPTPCRILDLGCGPGNLWRLNDHRIGKDWTIILGDFSQGMLTKARQSLPRQNSNFLFSLMGAGAIPFASKSFDVVVANHMLYHVPNLDRTLTDIWRVLRPGGKLFASTNSKAHLAELDMLMPEGLPFVPVGEVIKTFTLENGADSLRPYFKYIEQHRHEDGLIVTEVQPIVDYCLSRQTLFAEELPGPQLIQKFSAKVNKKMQENGGVIKISKNSGIFICEK